VKGGGTLAHARTVTVEAGSVIDADATSTGNGGSVVLWSDGVTNFAGTISANGGALGGDGGFVETSGHELGFGAGLQVATTAAHGATGTWLLDPYDVTISNAADSFISVDTASSPNTATPSGSGSNLNVTTLQIALGSNNMVVQTSGAGSAAGNITVLQSVIWAADTTLTLNADTSTGGILLDGTVTGTGSGSRLVLNAGAGGINQAASYITVNTLNATTTNGGSIALTSSVNAITTLGTSSASGSFALTNGQDLNVSGPITSNGTLSLVTTIGDLNINAALSDSQAGASYTLSAADALNISKDLTLSGAGAQLSLSAGSSYSLLSGARVSLPDSGASLSIDGQAYTLIHDAAGLQSVNGASFYALGNDIDASATSGWNSGAGFQAIDNFYGTLAGLGHFVDRLTINRPGQPTQGLFGLMSGTARDLTLSNVSINGNSIVGGVAGRLSNGTLSNVHVTGTVTGQGALVGGLVGWSDIAVIDLSSSAASVSGTDEVGGLVGRNRVGSITTSYATGAVTGTGSGIGGLVGTSVQGSTLTDVYASGLVTGASGTGGVVGSWDATPITTNNVYWDMDSTGQSTSVVGTGFSSGSARTQSTYAGFDFSNVWVMIAGETRPMLRNEYSTVIATPAALQLMSQDLTASYRLGANIDLTTAFTADGNGNYADLWGASGFWTIGNSGTPFFGSFDGQGHTITGLTIDRPSQTGVGLFGQSASGAIIRNVGLVGGSVTGATVVGQLVGLNAGTIADAYATGTASGSAYVGGLAGYNSGSLANVYATGAISGSAYIGGLAGGNFTGTISNAHATGTVTGTNNVGGLVGIIYSGALANVYATGMVTGSNSVGGLAGTNSGSISVAYATGEVVLNGGGRAGGLAGGNSSGSITNAYATGAVRGNGSGAVIGGLVGTNENASITNAYAAGAVTGDGTGQVIGGLVGYNIVATITNAYATGAVTGAAYVGGLIGINSSGSVVTNTYAVGAVTGSGAAGGFIGSNSGSVTSSFWDSSVSGGLPGIGGGSASAGVTGLTTAQFQDTAGFMTGATGWNFDTTWAPSSSGYYPQLYALTPVAWVRDNTLTSTYGDASAALAPAVVAAGGPAAYVFGPPGDSLVLGGGSIAVDPTIDAGTHITALARNDSRTSTGGVTYRVFSYGSSTHIVGRAVLVVAANGLQSYGSTSPGYGFAASGWKNGQGDVNLTGLNYSTTATAASNVGGGYSIIASGGTLTGAAAGNYTLSYASGSFAVTPALLTVTAGNGGMTYGDSVPGPGYSVSGWRNGQGDSLLSGVSVATNATSTSNAGAGYSTSASGGTLSGAAAGNYMLSYVSGSFAVTPALLTVTAGNGGMTYGDNVPSLGYSVSGWRNGQGDSLLSGVSVATNATSTSNVGAGYSTSASGGTLSGAATGNYTLSYAGGSFAVTPRPLTVTAVNGTMVYGDAVPTLAYVAGGLVNGEGLSGALATSATSASDVGSYAITQGTLAASPNYLLTYIGGDMQVAPALLTVTAGNGTMTYGDGVPTLTYTVSGWRNGQGDSLLRDITVATDATSTSHVGAGYVTTAAGGILSGAAVGNYTLLYLGGSFSVTPRPITVAADNQSRDVGEPNPALTWSLTSGSLVNGDSLTGVLGTPANLASAAGLYPILQNSLAASANYALTYMGGVLTVLPAAGEEPVPPEPETRPDFLVDVQQFPVDQWIETIRTVALMQEVEAGQGAALASSSSGGPSGDACSGTAFTSACKQHPHPDNQVYGRWLTFPAQ
jgi:hypothetical protein